MDLTENLTEDLAAGAFAGFVATMPMTAVMEWLHQRLPWYERYQLPPAQVAQRVIEQRLLRRHVDNPEHSALAIASHFAYGSTVGVAYAFLMRQVPVAPALKGSLFGLTVWAASYLGWLPAAGIMAPATQHPARRNALMIVAHIIWGSATGILVESLLPPDQ